MEQTRWRAKTGFDLSWHAWNSEYVVYHGGTGNTHLLDAAAGRLLRHLQEAPADPAELSALIMTDVRDLHPDDLLAYTCELLTELQRLALVERLA